MKALAKPVTAVTIFLFFLLFWYASAYSRSIYMWVDSKGNKHYTTSYGKIPLHYRNQIAKPPTEASHEKQKNESIKSKKTKRVVGSSSRSSFRSYRNEPNGFRGIEWDTNLSRLKSMQYHASGPSYSEITFYKRKNDSLQMGSARFQSIVYVFWRERLEGVLLTVKGSDNWDTLRQACFERFGKGKKPNRYIEEYIWDGDTSKISLRYSHILGKGKLYIFSTKVSNQMKEYQRLRGRRMGSKWVLVNLIPQ